ncbi:MAG: ABC transporter ATP-binding protein [Candidatus Omnitrophica bacterium]|nr:ABC transporter ATP-binding protein [Candidatus Omnitrophota bacterium]
MSDVKLIRAEKVNKKFKQGPSMVHAVKDVDFEMSPGEKVYLYGPSGAGKSTLLDILGNLTRASSGKIFFRDKDVCKMSDKKRSLMRNLCFGFVFQFYYLLPELTVLENVMLPSRIIGKNTRGIKDKAMGLLKRVKMDHRIKHKPLELSGGEAQRVSIARALINSPEILFCDEPTGNLDSAMASSIYEIVNDISREEKMSLLIVTHHELDKTYYDTKYLMKDGVLNRQ